MILPTIDTQVRGVTDPEPLASALLDALGKAAPYEGPPTDITLSRVTCKKDPGAPARCSIQL
jgi:hypothetical protein